MKKSLTPLETFRGRELIGTCLTSVRSAIGVLPASKLEGVHRRKVHFYTIPTRTRVWGSKCPVCMTKFHERPRLSQHLAYDSSSCKAIFEESEPLELDEATVAALDARDALVDKQKRHVGLPDSFAEAPAFRSCV